MSRFNHRDGRSIAIGDAAIYCEERGNASGAPIVFLHGGLGNIEDFNALVPTLGKTYRCIGIDSRGQGKSTLGSEALTYARLQRDVEHICGVLRIDAPMFIGHSDGGIVALRIAAAGAVRPSKVVTLGAHWTLGPDDPTRGIYTGVTPEGWLGMFPEGVAAYRGLNPAPDFEKLVPAVRGMWLDAGEEGYPGESIRDIDCPVLVVRGDDDMLVSRAHAVELADRVLGAKLMNIPFAGHCAHQEQPEIVLWALRHFME